MPAFVCCRWPPPSLFGALHDQISYTVSPEYFTRFKFIQFGLLDPGLPERLRAAEVGWLASWWMGLPLGIFAGVAAFLHRSRRTMVRHLLLSLPLMTTFTLLFALGGLAYGCWGKPAARSSSRPTATGSCRKGSPTRGVFCAGYMHNSAYLGGTLAIGRLGVPPQCHPWLGILASWGRDQTLPRLDREAAVAALQLAFDGQPWVAGD